MKEGCCIESRMKHFVLAVSLVAVLALISCGGGPASQPNPNPAPSGPSLGLWVMPFRLSVAQDSSETIAVGAGACVGVAGHCLSACPVPSPINVQISGLPVGVTLSPASPVVPADCSPVPLTFSVSSSAATGSVTVTLTGTTGTLSGSVSLPFYIMPPNPLTSTPKCASSTPPPAPNPSPAPNEWTWEGGSNTQNQPGVYGTQGVPSASNVPGARVGASAWTDPSGNFWLFGGYGSIGTQADLNDLWRYSNGEWTWMGGSSLTEQPGIYGALGVPSAGNVPGAREWATGWTDAFGNFWLFGGEGLDSIGTRGYLNDLWKYDPATKMWTWMGGANTLCNIGGNSACAGVYGTQSIPVRDNVPGSRSNTSSWTDSCGTLWLFGGSGRDSTGIGGPLNDLWKYDPTTNMWTWMSGANISGQNGTYGTVGVPDSGNVPGSRYGAVTWIDRSGNLWLFGGEANDVNGIFCEETLACEINDLWKYDPATNTWTWMGGPDVTGQAGAYGTEGAPAPGNVPGGRVYAITWTDAAGNFWLFGGTGYDSRTNPEVFGDLNDLWKYDPATSTWTWMSGSDLADQPADYGTLGTAGPGNVLPGREWAVGWTDLSGNLWLFGGFDEFASPSGKFNDLWKYQP